MREFSAPEEPLEKTLEINRVRRHKILQMPNSDGEFEVSQEGNSTFYIQAEVAVQVDDISSPSTGTGWYLTTCISLSVYFYSNLAFFF